MKIIRTEYKSLNKSTKVGEIVEVSEKGIEVQSGDGTIIIKELQMPGKRKMNVKDYLLGNEIIKSKILK
jgi:methionyl-tRNA formyltransferase